MEPNTTHASGISDLVRELFDAYRRKDRPYLESLLSDDFTFSSPYDDHIDKAQYFERCWPNSDRILAHHIRKIAEDNDAVFVLYDCEWKSGSSSRNTEYFTFSHGKLRSVEVFFGDPPSGIAKDRYLAFIETGRLHWTHKNETDAEAQIRALIDDRGEAVRTKNLDRLMANVADDILSFDIVNPLQYSGSDQIRKRALSWFSSFQGPIGYEYRDLTIAAGDLQFTSID